MYFKKTIIFLQAILMAGILFSCTGKSSSGGDREGKPVEQQEESDASEIIGYTNNVIELLDRTLDWIDMNESRIEELMQVSGGEREKRMIASIPVSNYPNYQREKDSICINPPKSLGKEDAAFFKENISLYNEKFQSVLKNIATLQVYNKSEDYKDDNYAKGKKLSESIHLSTITMDSLREILYERIDVVAGKAEEITLKNHPLKEPMIAAKSDLMELKNLTNVFNNYSDGKIGIEGVEAAYDSLSKHIEVHKDAYNDIFKDYSTSFTAYKSLYRYYETSTLPDLRKFIRDVKEGKKMDKESMIEKANDEYNSVVDYYNRFVD